MVISFGLKQSLQNYFTSFFTESKPVCFLLSGINIYFWSCDQNKSPGQVVAYDSCTMLSDGVQTVTASTQLKGQRRTVYKWSEQNLTSAITVLDRILLKILKVRFH